MEAHLKGAKSGGNVSVQTAQRRQRPSCSFACRRPWLLIDQEDPKYLFWKHVFSNFPRGGTPCALPWITTAAPTFTARPRRWEIRTTHSALRSDYNTFTEHKQTLLELLCLLATYLMSLETLGHSRRTGLGRISACTIDSHAYKRNLPVSAGYTKATIKR